MKFNIRCDGIKNGYLRDIYGKYGDCEQKYISRYSFGLKWENEPIGTKSYCITFIDYDNCQEQGYPWIHWLVANIPAEMSSIEDNGSVRLLAEDNNIVQGINSWISESDGEQIKCDEYGGPAPELFDHEYEIRIYALDSEIDLKDGFFYNEMLKKMRGKVLDEAVIYAKYRC